MGLFNFNKLSSFIIISFYTTLQKVCVSWWESWISCFPIISLVLVSQQQNLITFIYFSTLFISWETIVDFRSIVFYSKFKCKFLPSIGNVAVFFLERLFCWACLLLGVKRNVWNKAGLVILQIRLAQTQGFKWVLKWYYNWNELQDSTVY